MNVRARPGLCGAFHCDRGFTLLEMCIVLFIIMLFAAAGLPAIESAFTEQTMRADSRELALMVRTAVLQSSDQHRPYVIDLTSSNFYLHPAEAMVGGKDQSDQDAASDADSSDKTNTDLQSEDVEVMHAMGSGNKLLAPDPDKPRQWVPMTPTQWRFQPGGLCLLPRVRFERDRSWQELGFNPLTGNVEDESYYFP
jgi:prepilin-type N-terminal cleavage/methylation domain-containing protein